MIAFAERRAYHGWIVPIAVLVLWEVGARLQVLPEFFVAPSIVLTELIKMCLSGELFEHISASLVRSLGGFALGTIVGLLLGLWAGVSGVAGSFFNPLASVVYPVPKVAFLPILVIWLGLGDGSKIATIALSAFFPVFINAYSGTHSVSKVYLWAARSMGASRLRIFFFVVLPATMPHIFSGMRIGLGLSFVVLFATEIFGARSGLGYLIGVAEDSRRYDLMYVAIISIGLLGFICDRILVVARRRVLVGQLIGKEELLG